MLNAKWLKQILSGDKKLLKAMKRDIATHRGMMRSRLRIYIRPASSWRGCLTIFQTSIPRVAHVQGSTSSPYWRPCILTTLIND